MCKQDVPSMDNHPSVILSNGNTGSTPATRPSSLPTSTVPRAGNALRGQLSSSPELPDVSDRLSSPSVRALARLSTINEVQSQETRHRASSSRASATGGSINGPSSHISRSAIQRPSVPVRRRQATPTKPLQQNQSRQRLKNLADIKPFEKFANLEVKLRNSPQSSKYSDDLRRVQLATTIHRNVRNSLAGRPLAKPSVLPQQNLGPDVKDLGLGRLTVVADQESCSFCTFECNYGSSNAEVLLPPSASCHICLDCQPSHFFDDNYESTLRPQMSTPVSLMEQPNTRTSKYPIVIKPQPGDYFTIQVKLSETALEVKSILSQHNEINWDLYHLVSGGAVLSNSRQLSTYGIGPKSLIEVVELKRFDGRDVTQYWRPGFCARCPWTQVDVKLAKLCMLCAEEKYAIITHSRHGAWTPFFKTYGDDDTLSSRYRQGNCMICTDLARMKCAKCPLIVCVNCSTHLDGRCKGSLNILLYSLLQEHIRNDAFLLRSDGGGF